MSYKIIDGNGTARFFESVGEGTELVPFQNVPADLMLRIPNGDVNEHESVNIFGYNGDIDTGTTPEDIWSNGGLWTPPTTARIHDIVSSDANDVSGGTGSRTIQIKGLDSNFEEQEETITMNGTTNVPTTKSYTRICCLKTLTAGSNGRNVGTITATAQTDSTITNTILAEKGQSLSAIYTVPANHNGFITRVYASMSRPAAASECMAKMELLSRPDASQSDAPLLTKLVFDLSVEGASFVDIEYRPYRKFTEKTDILLRCLSVTDSNTIISGGFDMILIPNS